MRTLKLTIAYDGTRYAGWQAQRQRVRSSAFGVPGKKTPTIQETLEHVLRKILQESIRVVGSGRTDAGVHALAQVAHVRTRSTLPRERLARSLNHLLPPEIAITRIDEMPASFHARFSAVGKRYRYRLFTGAVVTPFLQPYVVPVRAPLNIALMRREARALVGRHDVRGFATACSVGRGAVRTITSVALVRRGDELAIDIEGEGFLHTMARSIVGTLVDIGRGRLPPGTVRAILQTGSRRLVGTTAPARGLTLMEVLYPARWAARILS